MSNLVAAGVISNNGTLTGQGVHLYASHNFSFRNKPGVCPKPIHSISKNEAEYFWKQSDIMIKALRIYQIVSPDKIKWQQLIHLFTIQACKLAERFKSFPSVVTPTPSIAPQLTPESCAARIDALSAQVLQLIANDQTQKVELAHLRKENAKTLSELIKTRDLLNSFVEELSKFQD